MPHRGTGAYARPGRAMLGYLQRPSSRAECPSHHARALSEKWPLATRYTQSPQPQAQKERPSLLRTKSPGKTQCADHVPKAQSERHFTTCTQTPQSSLASR
jgi:hypothetical protein